MILSAADLIARLNHPKNSAKARVNPKTKEAGRPLDRNDHKIGDSVYLRDSTPGRRDGDKGIPEEIKIPAMVLARLGVSDSEIAGTFGMGPDSVTKIKNGSRISEQGKAIANEAVNTIIGKVTNRLDETIDALTPMKVMNSKAIDIAHIAKALSGVLGDLSPKDASKNINQVQVVIHGVNQKDVTHYEEVIVGS